MVKKILAAVLSVVMVGSVMTSWIVGASDSANAPEESVVLSDANLFYKAGYDVGFENVEVGGRPENTIQWTNNENATVVDSKAHNGDKCYFTAKNWQVSTLCVPCEVKAGNYYKLSFWFFAMGPNGYSTMYAKAGGNVLLDVTGAGGNTEEYVWFSGSPEDGVWMAANTGNWIYVERTIKMESDDTLIELTLNSATDTYIDDLCLLEIGDSLPTPEPTPEITPTPATPTPSATATPSESASDNLLIKFFYP